MMQVSVLILLFLVQGCYAVEVETAYGRVQGKLTRLADGTTVRAFMGIPYAKPPIGDLRFRRTEPVEPWSETLNCTRLKDVCTTSGFLTHPNWDRYSENCLYLNIYTPNDNSSGPYPVLVWLHGGAYKSGGNNMYPGHFYAARNVTAISINYRLGGLGFASTSDEVARGNWGLWDQRQALIFVKETISSFWGDPNRVTFAGQSAGASSVGLHILSNYSDGLFHQAIMHSGVDASPWAFNPLFLPPENYTKEIAERNNCPTSPSKDMIDCLKTKPYRDVTTGETPISGFISQGFAPVPDGPGGFLPENPYSMRRADRFRKDVRIMAGHTTHDGSMYLVPFVPEAADGGWNRSMHRYYIKERMLSWVLARYSEETVNYIHEALSYKFTDWPYSEHADKNRKMLVDMVTDIAYGIATDMVLGNHTQHNVTYKYHYGFMGTPHELILPPWMGTVHGLADVPYYWGYPLIPENPEVERDAELNFLRIFPWTERDYDFTNYIMDLIANFVKTGDPNTPPVRDPFTRQIVQWKAWTNVDYDYLYLGSDSMEQERLLRQDYQGFWQHYLLWVLEDRPETGKPFESTDGWHFKTETFDKFEDWLLERSKDLFGTK